MFFLIDSMSRKFRASSLETRSLQIFPSHYLLESFTSLYDRVMTRIITHPVSVRTHVPRLIDNADMKRRFICPVSSPSWLHGLTLQRSRTQSGAPR